jgi:flavin-dependent thymidylate synthase
LLNDSLAKVVIIGHTPEPERLCAAAASISTTKGTALEIYNKKQEKEKAQKLIKNVLRLGHATTIEHACFTIAFENISAFVEQFMIEFRLASFTVKSRRYVDFSQMGYYQPKFRFKTEISEQDKQYCNNLYNTHIKRLFSEYEYLLQNGIPREDARFLLPYCYRSNFYCTVNARELQHIIHVALEGRGSKYPEIKAIGVSLLEQAKTIAPGIFGVPLGGGRDDKEERLRELLSEDLLAGETLEKRESGQEGSNSAFCEILRYSESPEKLVASAVLIKHTLCATETAQRILQENKVLEEKLLKIACEDERKRELEQVCFTFRINNLTLAGLTHLARHRVQSLNVPSFTEFGLSQGYILPDSIQEKPHFLARYVELWQEHQKTFCEFVEAGVVKEDLVYLYLSGNLVDVVTTMNGRELFHFLRLRTCQRAQWEIRAIAEEMLVQLRKVAPLLFKYFGPSCYVLGKCPEGKLSCGQKEKVVERFSQGEE